MEELGYLFYVESRPNIKNNRPSWEFMPIGSLLQPLSYPFPFEFLSPKPETGNVKRVIGKGASKLAHCKDQMTPDFLSLLSLEGPRPRYLR